MDEITRPELQNPSSGDKTNLLMEFFKMLLLLAAFICITYIYGLSLITLSIAAVIFAIVYGVVYGVLELARIIKWKRDCRCCNSEEDDDD